MQLSWKKIIEEIQRLKLLAPEDLKQLKEETLGTSVSAERQLLQLVNDKKLTKFQALQLIEGKGSRLLLGNYVIMKPLGQGGMGTVFKAKHPQMNRIVAIKTILPHLAMQGGVASKRFSNEIRFLAQLSHPNIVQAFDADVHDGMPFLVTEFVEGIDLKKLVEKHGPLDVPTALRYLSQAASALAYAHANNIVHRDVKPANLIVKSDGQIKLLDLGIARVSDPSENEGSEIGLTADNSIIGSLEYTSPEQFTSPKSVGPRSDIYSLGCTFYYLIRGKVPYPGKSPLDFLQMHPKAPIPKLCDSDQVLSSKLNTLFQRLVAKTPDKRIQEMSEVASEFQRLSEDPELTGEVAVVDSDKPARRPKKPDASYFDSASNSLFDFSSADRPWYRRRSVLAVGGIAIAGSIIGGVAWMLTSTKPTNDQPRESISAETVISKPGSSDEPEVRPKVQKVQGSKVFRVE